MSLGYGLTGFDFDWEYPSSDFYERINLVTTSVPIETHTCPLALIEAMFAERPIVASDIPVHRETIAHEKSGLLVRVKDPEAIAHGITWMLEHPAQAKQMGIQARKAALRRFDVDQIAAQYEQLYESLLERWSTRV